MKYVITSRGPILFPDNFNHSDFKALDLPIESAGSVMLFIPGEVNAFIGPGGSMSLGIGASETDEKDIVNFLKVDSD